MNPGNWNNLQILNARDALSCTSKFTSRPTYNGICHEFYFFIKYLNVDKHLVSSKKLLKF